MRYCALWADSNTVAAGDALFFMSNFRYAFFLDEYTGWTDLNTGTASFTQIRVDYYLRRSLSLPPLL